MGSFVNRENMLLGYIPQKSISSSSKSLEVDFHDVFGGPPRRSSVQDWRHSNSNSNSNEDIESSSTSYKDEEPEEERVFDEKKERVYSRDPWTGLIEKPVFGEENSMRNRGKYRNDDFFDDIFRGDESSSSTLRKPSRDLHSSSSRVSSLSRSLSFQSESFRGGSSLPLVLSLPVKSTTETDSSAFPAQGHNLRKNKETAIIGFPSSPGASTSRFSIEVTQRQEGLKNELQSPYRQSSLSKEVSLRSEGLEQVSKSVKRDSDDYCKEDSSTSEITYNSTQFHFSIYKWASAGVPIAMSPREENKSSTKESSKSDDTMNQHSASSLQGVEHSSDNYDMLTENNKSLKSLQKNQDDNSVLTTESVFVDSEITEEVISAKREQKPRTNIQNIFKKVPGNLLSQNAKKDNKTGSDPSCVDISSFKGPEKKIPVSKKEALESEEPLYCLLTDTKAGSGKRGADNSSVRETEKQMPVSKTEISKPDSLYCLLKDDKHDLGASGGDKKIFGSKDKRIRNSKKETPKSEEPLYCLLKDDCQGNAKAVDKATKKGTVNSIYTSAGDVGKKKKVKKQSGKRNILSPTEENSSSLQDTPLDEKPVVNKAEGMVKNFVNTFNQNAPSKPLRNVAIRKQDDTVTVVAADKAEEQQNIKSDQKKNVILTDSTPGRVDQSSKQFAKPHREIKTVDQVLDCAFERNKNSASCAEPVIDTIEIAVDNVEDTSEEFDCTVKEFVQDQNKDPQVGQSHEEIQASDAKIRKWANGKEGNIRSLLSTLQYVLWPESGWKPVPLVDIIEGGSVRRSYQKALLCLHPDKLQQKGAAPHQKYIAEKVFDILQEAWEHFNSLGSF